MKPAKTENDLSLLSARVKTMLEGPDGELLEMLLYILENPEFRECPGDHDSALKMIRGPIQIYYDGTRDRKERRSGCKDWRTCGPGKRLGCGPGEVEKAKVIAMQGRRMP